MQGVAVGWQIYALTNDPLDLGLVGLVQFFPLVAIRSSPARCSTCSTAAWSPRSARSARRWRRSRSRSAPRRAGSTARRCSPSCSCPARRARSRSRPCTRCCPASCRWRCCRARSRRRLPRSRPRSSAGPALGGLLYAARAGGGLRDLHRRLHRRERADRLSSRSAPARAATSGRSRSKRVFAGFAYIRSHPILLGAISLDLFAVLLGGVTALLPIYARDILQPGPGRSACCARRPRVGALAVSVVLARSCDRRPRRPHHVRRGRGVRGGEPRCSGCRPRSVLSFLALVDLRRVRRRQRRHPPVAGADAHAATTCWAG